MPPEPKSAKQTGPVVKPRTNVYTMMLILSFLAIVTGCVLLWLELNTYGEWPQWKIAPGTVTGI